MLDLLRRILQRCMKSFGYCRDALACTYAKEESFRLEILVYFLIFPFLWTASWPLWKIIAMTASYLLIPLVEVLNSAIEDVCDLITTEKNPLVKNAKDKGALAVLFAIVVNALVLIALLLA